MKAKAHTFNILRIVVVFFHCHGHNLLIDICKHAIFMHIVRGFFCYLNLIFFACTLHMHIISKIGHKCCFGRVEEKNVYKIALEIPPIGLNHHIFFGE